MKFTRAAVRKAAAKRDRAEGSSGAGAQAPLPKRLTIREPSPPRETPAPLEVDLTADTPPPESAPGEATVTEEVVVEDPRAGEPATEEPAAELRVPNNPTPPRAAGESGVPDQPPEQAARPPRAAPPHAEAAEGSRGGPAARATSLMNDGRRAVHLMAQLDQPDFQEELRNIGVTRFFRGVASSFVRVANSFTLLRTALEEGEALMNQLQQDEGDAQARAEAAERALGETRASCAKEIQGAEDRASEAIEQKRVALNRLAEAEGAIEARNLRIADLESNLRSAKEKTKKIADEAKRADEKARKAEEKAKRAEEGEARVAALLTAERETRASEIEAAVRAGATKAVEDFRASDLFVREALEGNADSYLQGFREAKEKIARVLDVPRALEIRPDEDSDGASPSGPAAET